MPRSLNAQNTIKYRPYTSQEERILKFYVDERKDEEQFDCLKRNGFFGLLSKYAGISYFNQFIADINRVAKQQKYRSKRFCFTKNILN